MQLLTVVEFLKQYGNALQNLPFCFLEAYLVHQPSFRIINYQNYFSLFKLSTIKGFKTVQFIFPPVNIKGERLSVSLETQFCNEVILFFQKEKLCHRIVQPQNYCLFKSVPEGAIHIPFGTYRVNLMDKSNEALLANMQARYRTAINQVGKLNVALKFGESELKNFVQLHQETMRRTNSYFEDELSLKKIIHNSPHSSLVVTIYIDGELQGGAFIQYSSYSAYYMHGASAQTTKAAGAIKFLHYQLMCKFSAMHIKYYDFVGARLSNPLSEKLKDIQDFKKRFGSELELGYLWKKDIHKTVCRIYDTLLRIKCILKRKDFPLDIIDQELSYTR